MAFPDLAHSRANHRRTSGGACQKMHTAVLDMSASYDDGDAVPLLKQVLQSNVDEWTSSVGWKVQLWSCKGRDTRWLRVRAKGLAMLTQRLVASHRSKISDHEALLWNFLSFHEAKSLFDGSAATMRLISCDCCTFEASFRPEASLPL